MRTSEFIANWLTLGPIFNQAHQTDRHASDDGHPTAAEIIQAIDRESLDPGQLTASLSAGPSAGDVVVYGDGSLFPARVYKWQPLSFGDLDWTDPRAVQDAIHMCLGAGRMSRDPLDPASFAGKHHALVFFLSYVVSPDARSTRLCVRSDDAIRVWLNDVEIRSLRNVGDRDINAATQESCAEVSLRQGVNILFAVVAETHYEWGFSARFEHGQDFVYLTRKPELFTVGGLVADALDQPLVGVQVSAFDKDLRSEQLLGEQHTDTGGRYEIHYTREQFRRAEKRSADLVVRSCDASGTLLAASAVHFNASQEVTIDLVAEAAQGDDRSLFKRIGSTIDPLLDQVPIVELEENGQHQDISFLAAETGLPKEQLARFTLAHRLVQRTLPAEFWFALLGGSFFEVVGDRSLTEQVMEIRAALTSLGEREIRKSLARAFHQQAIADALEDESAAWVEAFLDLTAHQTLSGDATDRFLKQALEHAGIADNDRQKRLARLFNRYRALSPALLEELAQDEVFTPVEVADLRTSFQLAELTRSGFSVVKMLKERFEIRRPEQVRLLARQSEDQWAGLIEQEFQLGTIDLPLESASESATLALPVTRIYAKTLEHQFRDAFPTAAFAGGLERAQANGGPRGIRYARTLLGLLDSHPDLELGCTTVDDFLDGLDTADAPELRLELKAVQRIFKLAPTFEATDTLLADGLHSAQKVYRIGENQFVRRYASRAGLSPEVARRTWARAAETHAAVLTLLGDLHALEPSTLPAVLQGDGQVLEQFPNWNNLFQTGDICHCEQCRSMLGPAAYYADTLMFLVDREAGTGSVRDILFARRPDLGWLELGCENSHTSLPYVDLVCEVLEAAVDRDGANDLVLPGLTELSADADTAGAEVTAAFSSVVTDQAQQHPENYGKQKIDPGEILFIDAVVPESPADRAWVVHAEHAVYLLSGTGGSDMSARLLPNTKADSEELRAYPAHVNPKAYAELRTARFPHSLPFDLFAEEARGAFRKCNLQRWDLMRTLRATNAPGNPGDAEIAAEYFGIGCRDPQDAAAPFDEKQLIFTADETVSGQRETWGETAGAGWLDTLANVRTFLVRSGIDYESLLALLELPFINPHGTLAIEHLDASCDTDQKRILGLDIPALDRIHRFLRLWRKLEDWELWELDLVIRLIGKGTLNEAFLTDLYHLCRLRTRLGPKTSVEELCGLFADLNTETRFSEAHKPRAGGLYQQVFLNRQRIQPLDPALEVSMVKVESSTTGISEHQPAILAALGISAADLDLFAGLTSPKGNAPYINGELTLNNLSFLWRHSWLAKRLKLKARDWVSVLALLREDIQTQVDSVNDIWKPQFVDGKTALNFVEKVDQLTATGHSPDELSWLLAADGQAQAAVKEPEMAHFLSALRSSLQAIRNEYDSAAYGDPLALPDSEAMTARLTALLQNLHRNEKETQLFLATLRGEVEQQLHCEGLPTDFSFPDTITGEVNKIPIRYEPVLVLTGPGITEDQRDLLLTDPLLAQVTGIDAYRDAIEQLYLHPGRVRVIGLPPGFAFPDTITGAPNHIGISYEPLLRFTGLMTAAQRDTMLGAPSLATITGLSTYRDAVVQLYETTNLALKFLDPVFTAALSDLPTTVDSKALSEFGVGYDAENGLLSIVGILSLDQRTALEALSSDQTDMAHADYITAIASLFEQPRSDTVPQERIWLQETDLRLDDPGNVQLPINLATAITRALAYLSRVESEALVLQQASTALDLSPALTRRLLTEYPVLPDTLNLLTYLAEELPQTRDPMDAERLPVAFEGWGWALRVAALWRQWGLKETEWEGLQALSKGADFLDADEVPLDGQVTAASPHAFLNTSRFMRFKASLPETGITLVEVLGKVLRQIQGGGGYDTSQFARDVSLLNGAWDEIQVATLVETLDADYPEAYLLAETWERLRRAFYFIDGLNTDAATVRDFAAPAMTESHCRTLKRLLVSRFGDETWPLLSAEIQDRLRERKRDALVAYLLHHRRPKEPPTGKWENPNDLYAYYLIDPQMSACQLTSRLVAAAGSAQLFVQRCFMGLEPGVVVDAEGDDGDMGWRWWSWMRKYRVWEANRKVFLWPENWIEPELRRERSPFFKELENELLQNEINQETVEQAFAGYLEKLDGVARLEVAGFYHEDDGDETIIHVFGRTPGGEPHLYYYRRYDYRQWTPWEKVDLDILGDYLIPAVISKRLFLFWPVFTDVPDESGNNETSYPDENTSMADLKAKNKLRLQMAVSDYRQGKWTPKRVSTDAVETESYKGKITKSRYKFYFVDRSSTDGRFGIYCDGYSEISPAKDGVDTGAYLFGTTFELGCKGVPEISPPGMAFGSPTLCIHPDESACGENPKYMNMTWVESRTAEDVADDLSLQNTFSSLFFNVQKSTQVLGTTPGTFQFTPAWQLSYFDRLLLDGVRANTDDWLASLSSNSNFPIMAATARFYIEWLTEGWDYKGFTKRKKKPTTADGWLPFFFGDQTRTFFVRPTLSWWSHGNSAHGCMTVWELLRFYYPDGKQIFRDWEAAFAAAIQAWMDTHLDLAVLPLSTRQLWEVTLAGEFPEMPTPPDPASQSEPFFTDEQLREMIKRFGMRFAHLLLGKWALQAFQFRRFHFHNFYHPFVCDFAKLVYNPLKGIPALMSRETQLKDTGFDFRQTYQPTDVVVDPIARDYYPREDVDFSPDGAYAPYNWELFFHTPLLIANALSRNQRFEEAMRWYHFIFNPIGVESGIPGTSPMSKYWITKPFFETTDPQYTQQRIEQLLTLLAGEQGTSGKQSLPTELEKQVRDWRTYPFEPHRIANYRTVAYQKTVVMKYLDNLIAWGDYLFRQDSMESINEATQLYVQAAEILGPRPQRIPPPARPVIATFNEIEAKLDAFSNALVEVENLIPIQPGSSQGVADTAPLPTLYFCIPHNEKMLKYWDRVADRLYKIRHCMNIEGVVRQLALFEPPIDPGALVKAVAGGMDIGSALAELNAPLPLYRFHVSLQQANTVCADVKALGGALLAALEKRDAEALGQLRQGQEIGVLEAITDIREKQVEEATTQAKSLRLSRKTVEERRNYYRDIEKISGGENLSALAHSAGIISEVAATVVSSVAGSGSMLPDATWGVAGFGGSPVLTATWGGSYMGSSGINWAAFFSGLGGILHSGANLLATQAGHERRWDDWKLQERLAEKELVQLDEQIAAADKRVEIAEKERDNHLGQIDNAKTVDEFMRSKYTKQELYQWQVGQISDIYFQAYRLAHDLAKRAERCFRFELGLRDSSFIDFGYWDSLKKGLLSGERLQQDLRRLEIAYLEQNRRELELIKHISLARLDPLALVQLRETGRCSFQVPEELFDLDYPGHYFRRIQSVSLTLPCVTGPYTTVACSLRLLKNSVRIDTSDGDNGYRRNTDEEGLPADDARFVETNVPVRAIATSSGQNDSGVFELSFRDERYLPFEGAGAISMWSLELFSDPANPDFGLPLRQFDYSTIADTVLHIKYTAREDAGVFKNGAITHLRDYFSEDDSTRSWLALDLRREFGSAWSRFLHPVNQADGNVFELEMSTALFPQRDAAKTLKINTIVMLARCTDEGPYDATLTPPLPVPPPVGVNAIPLENSPEYGDLHFGQKDVATTPVEIEPTNPSLTWRITITRPGGGDLIDGEVEDLIMVLGYEWK